MKALRPLAVAAGGTLAAHWSPADGRRASGRRASVRDSDDRRRRRSASDLRRRTSSGRDAGGPHGARPRGRFGGLLRQRGAGRALSRSSCARSPPRATSSACTATGIRRGASGAADCSPTTRAAPCDAVTAAAGVEPRLYRPPHGVFSLAGLRLIRELGLEPLLWSKWGRDWERRATPRRSRSAPPRVSGRRRSAAPRRGSLLRTRKLAGDRRRCRADRRPDRGRGSPDGLRMIERPKGGRAWKP